MLSRLSSLTGFAWKSHILISICRQIPLIFDFFTKISCIFVTKTWQPCLVQSFYSPSPFLNTKRFIFLFAKDGESHLIQKKNIQTRFIQKRILKFTWMWSCFLDIHASLMFLCKVDVFIYQGIWLVKINTFVQSGDVLQQQFGCQFCWQNGDRYNKFCICPPGNLNSVFTCPTQFWLSRASGQALISNTV